MSGKPMDKEEFLKLFTKGKVYVVVKSTPPWFLLVRLKRVGLEEKFRTGYRFAWRFFGYPEASVFPHPEDFLFWSESSKWKLIKKKVLNIAED